MIQKLEDAIWFFQLPVCYSKNYKDPLKIKEMVMNKDSRLLRKAFEWRANERISNLEIIERLKTRGLTITDRNLSNIFCNPFVWLWFPNSFRENRLSATVSNVSSSDYDRIWKDFSHSKEITPEYGH